MVDSAVVHVVDDDPLALRSLGSLLREEGTFKVATFGSPAAALRAAEQRAPDLLLCDLHMQELDGATLLARLREREPDVVGLILTSVGDVEGRSRAVAAVGALGQIDKPWDRRELLLKVRAALERRALARTLREARSELDKRGREVAASREQAARAQAELRSTHSELATATERLVQAEQLAAVGRVVTGIAHEIANALTLVGYAEAIKSRVADDPQLVEFADIIVTAQKRLAAMVDEIRDFAGGGGLDESPPLPREPSEMSCVVDEALAILRFDRDVRARTIARSYKARPLVALHRQKFSQVVINLVSNAVLATAPGDTITVELNEDPARQVAVLTVADAGAGMAPDVLARLGEPFFTTRGDRGSGLGVGICKRIVEEHGGALTFESQLGRGTRATATLPLLPEEEAK